MDRENTQREKRQIERGKRKIKVFSFEAYERKRERKKERNKERNKETKKERMERENKQKRHNLFLSPLIVIATYNKKIQKYIDRNVS